MSVAEVLAGAEEALTQAIREVTRALEEAQSRVREMMGQAAGGSTVLLSAVDSGLLAVRAELRAVVFGSHSRPSFLDSVTRALRLAWESVALDLKVRRARGEVVET
jgi:hypothetical protein